MIFAAVAGHRSGRALPSLRDARQRQSMERIGRESIYRDRNAVQTKPATSETQLTQTSVKALAFDTGGTVLDWHRGIRTALAETGARHGVERDWTGITNAYRRRALQRMTNQEGPGFNIDDVHRSVLDELVGEYGLDVFLDAEGTAIARCWHSLDAWPDFPAALERLRRSYIAVSFTILSVSLIIDTAP